MVILNLEEFNVKNVLNCIFCMSCVGSCPYLALH
ncbi:MULTISPECIES: 4Fe-4S binding protein [Methanococcaceae]|nr:MULTISPECIES: 4Fe-4S binding protein [Methanococcaceae]